MAKPLAGKRLYEAWGRSAHSRGLPITAGRVGRQRWPEWAKSAWARGWLNQQTGAMGTQHQNVGGA